MLEHWQETSPAGNKQGFVVEKSGDDGLKLTLNILSRAGFGVPIPFKPVQHGRQRDPQNIFDDSSTPPQGFDFTFSTAIAYVSTKIITVILAYKMLPRRLPRQLVPSFVRERIAAYRDLDAYLQKLVVKRKAGVERSDSSAENLIDGMLLSQMRGDEDAGGRGLTDIEIMGNMFIFAIAGHETTATTFRYALLLLALNQDVQNWVYEGVVEATKDAPSEISDWDYETLFPKLVTPLCVMVCATSSYWLCTNESSWKPSVFSHLLLQFPSGQDTHPAPSPTATKTTCCPRKPTSTSTSTFSIYRKNTGATTLDNSVLSDGT